MSVVLTKKVSVFCGDIAYCLVPNINFAECNKTEYGFQMVIPLHPKCVNLTVKCAGQFMYKRNLFTYKVPKELKSTYNLTADQLFVNSKAIGIYPGGVCKFLIINQNCTELIASNFHETTENKMGVKDVLCSFSVPIAKLSNGFNDFKITVYPSRLSEKFGTNDFIRIFIYLNVSLFNCHQEYTYVNQVINCTCVRTDNYQITAQPMWYNSRDEIQSNGSSILSFQAFNNRHDYFCVARLYYISSNILRYSIVLHGVSLTTKHKEIFASSTSVALLLFAIVLFCVVMRYKQRFRKHCRYTETSIPRDDGLGLPPLHHIEMTNEQSYHYINDVNPGPLVNQSDYYSNFHGPLRQTDDPPISRRIVESLDLQTISGLNDGYSTQLNVDLQTTDTIYQNVQSTNAYVTFIDHYSTID